MCICTDGHVQAAKQPWPSCYYAKKVSESHLTGQRSHCRRQSRKAVILLHRYACSPCTCQGDPCWEGARRLSLCQSFPASDAHQPTSVAWSAHSSPRVPRARTGRLTQRAQLLEKLRTDSCQGSQARPADGQLSGLTSGLLSSSQLSLHRAQAAHAA